MLTAYHNATDVATSASGALVLQKYNFSGNMRRVQARFTSNLTHDAYGFGSAERFNILYGWTRAAFDSATHPDHASGQQSAELYRLRNGAGPDRSLLGQCLHLPGRASTSNRRSPTPDRFNPNRIKLVVSSDGGNNFTGQAIANIDSTAAGQRQRPDDRTRHLPALTVSQGRLPKARAARAATRASPGARSPSPGTISAMASSWPTLSRRAGIMPTPEAQTERSPGGPRRLHQYRSAFPTVQLATLTNLTVTVAAVHPNDANPGPRP